MSSRPTWDDTWLSVAAVIARRSLCVRDRVGAVIVDPHNRVVAVSYNGPPSGFVHDDLPCVEWCLRARSASPVADGVRCVDPGYHDCPALHSEANALSVCDRSMRENGTIYVTSQVCLTCAKLIANSGLATVVVRATEDHPHRNAWESYEFLERCGLTVVTS